MLDECYEFRWKFRSCHIQENDVFWLVPPADNPIQMTKICPTCTSVCDLCRNGFFWRQDSSLGLLDVNIIGGRNRLD